jgi:non-ribosomal peptide synthetase component E (peptide arylation enzyme)
VTAETVAGLLDASAANQPDRPLLRDCADATLTLADVAVLSDELCGFLDQRGLMKQKWPERLVVVDEFPLTGLGKVAKSTLAEQIAGISR